MASNAPKPTAASSNDDAEKPLHIPSPIVSHYAAEIERLLHTPPEDTDEMWAQLARSLLQWTVPFSAVRIGSFTEKSSSVAWFADGQVNICWNCVDRHAMATPDACALMYEADDASANDAPCIVTYAELLENVCRFANVLKEKGVKRGDVVTLYMPTTPSAVYAMLACARIGAVHNVVFGGFSAEALASRIDDSRSVAVFTVGVGLRGGKRLPLKSTLDAALALCRQKTVRHVFVCDATRQSAADYEMCAGRDSLIDEQLAAARAYCPCEPMPAEAPLFIMYTSGSTGTPKGLVHTTGGYAVYAAATQRFIFDFTPEDRFGCFADIGWITGHTYVVYGPLLNGGSTLIFGSVPTFPDASRMWRTVERFRLTHVYTAPTVVRALKKNGDAFVEPFAMQSLRVLGSVGEPINDEAWRWYFEVVGRRRCHLVDTYWQSETGGIVLGGFAGYSPMRAAFSAGAFFGIRLGVERDAEGVAAAAATLLPEDCDAAVAAESLPSSRGGRLVIRDAWPGIARTVLNDDARFRRAYFHASHGGAYVTGDAAIVDDRDGFVRILGRTDDVINVSGHRLSTAEIESAVCHTPGCAEAACVAMPDDLTGLCVVAFVSAATANKQAVTADAVRASVRRAIGSIAAPKHVVFVRDLPKTRSGKIMRRLVRDLLLEGRLCGDTSTLQNPDVLLEIRAELALCGLIDAAPNSKA